MSGLHCRIGAVVSAGLGPEFLILKLALSSKNCSGPARVKKIAHIPGEEHGLIHDLKGTAYSKRAKSRTESMIRT